MGLVSDSLCTMLANYIEAHGTVIWYDPAGDYLVQDQETFLGIGWHP